MWATHKWCARDLGTAFPLLRSFEIESENPIKTITKYLLIAAAVVACISAGASSVSAQSASFIYVPSVDAVSPGGSFTFEVEIAFTPGGSVSNLEGLSYWFQQKTPAGAPFNFAITNRDASIGPFTDLQTSGITYPQNLNPVNANDLGGLQPTGTPGLGAGTYAVADLTVSVSNTAALGTYVIDNTTSGGKISVITDTSGHTFAIPEADFTIDVIPEPATWLTPTLGIAALLFIQRRRILRLVRAN